MGFARHLKLSYSLHTPMLEANIYWFPVWQALLEAQKIQQWKTVPILTRFLIYNLDPALTLTKYLDLHIHLTVFWNPRHCPYAKGNSKE